MGSVTLTTEEYEQLKSYRLMAEARCVELEVELSAARAEDPAGRIKGLAALSRALIVPLRFAIANMPPEVTRKWPVGSLKTISMLLANLPDASADDKTLAIELMAFANDTERHEHERLKTSSR